MITIANSIGDSPNQQLQLVNTVESTVALSQFTKYPSHLCVFTLGILLISTATVVLQMIVFSALFVVQTY